MSGERDWIGDRIELYQALKLFPNWSNRRIGLLLNHSPQWVGKWRKRWDTPNSIQPSDFAGKSRRQNAISPTLKSICTSVQLPALFPTKPCFYRLTRVIPALSLGMKPMAVCWFLGTNGAMPVRT
jgi:hypothetical protein